MPQFGHGHCAAFPAAIVGNELDHRQLIEGDQGVRFEARRGDEFRPYAVGCRQAGQTHVLVGQGYADTIIDADDVLGPSLPTVD